MHTQYVRDKLDAATNKIKFYLTPLSSEATITRPNIIVSCDVTN